MNIAKTALFTVSGALGFSALAAFGGIGIVAGGAAVGLSALEVMIVGGAAGSCISKIHDDQEKAALKAKEADAATKKANKRFIAAQTYEKDLRAKADDARKALDALNV